MKVVTKEQMYWYKFCKKRNNSKKSLIYFLISSESFNNILQNLILKEVSNQSPINRKK